jgi:hypothetical protein
MQGIFMKRSFVGQPGVIMPAILVVVLCMTGQLFAQPAVMLERALSDMRRVKTFSCSIIRKQCYKGVVKTALCAFHYNRQKGKSSYVYAAPYDYSFWVDDSAVCGVKRNGNQGYRVTASSDFRRYRTLLESIHLCRPLFRFVAIDTLRVSLKASIDDSLYFEYPAGSGREVVKVDRGRNVVTLMESFDSTGAVKRQTLFEYETKNGKTARIPRQIVTRGNATGFIETDTLLLSHLEVNKGLAESIFTPPSFLNQGIGQ